MTISITALLLAIVVAFLVHAPFAYIIDKQDVKIGIGPLKGVPVIHQERIYTAPMWYTPWS